MVQIKLKDERGFNQLFAPVGSTPIRAHRRNSWFIAQAHRLNAKRILEIGCGTGEAAAQIAAGVDAEVVGIDISDSFLTHARETHNAPNLRFEKLDLLGEDPQRFGKFDMIYGNGILHHLVVRLDPVLRILHSMTQAGGGLAFIEPNFLNPYCAFIFGTKIGRKWALLEPDEMAFTAAELNTTLRRTGWHDITVATKDFLVPGIPTSFVKPISAVEPFLEATFLTRWLAQSHFVTAHHAPTRL
ncbi:class I SAM-dependent methyltransferase [Agrobacterium tumefaciens]|uniref:class I SAM-dependent methyltransferase n=1 Tax=Agrobacterium tumefaciens TaxID=358 RepID=UPI00059F95EC|nr:class I SAM-dependent methyltransferase [Agrobacterium tumefaciens]